MTFVLPSDDCLVLIFGRKVFRDSDVWVWRRRHRVCDDFRSHGCRQGRRCRGHSFVTPGGSCGQLLSELDSVTVSAAGSTHSLVTAAGAAVA